MTSINYFSIIFLSRLEKTGMMPYRVWNEKLRDRMAPWFKLLKDSQDPYKVHVGYKAVNVSFVCNYPLYTIQVKIAYTIH
jgi:hypothetical protein